MSDHEDETAPGWDAITEKVAGFFPGQEPQHWGIDPIPGQGIFGISAYDGGNYYLFVTYGLTELFDKVTADLSVSGFGFEFTMRITKAGDLFDGPPRWVLALLKQLGQYVYKNERMFTYGETVNCKGPLTGEPNTDLCGVICAEDPQFDGVSTPNGSVGFMTIIGITSDELAMKKASGAVEIIQQLAHDNPLLMTDLHR